MAHSLHAAASVLGASPNLIRMVNASGADEGVEEIVVVDMTVRRVTAATNNSLIGQGLDALTDDMREDVVAAAGHGKLLSSWTSGRCRPPGRSSQVYRRVSPYASWCPPFVSACCSALP